MVECGIRPEHECFDSGHVASLDPLLDMGLLTPPLQVSFVMGVTGGIRPTARNVAHMAEQVPDVPHQWGVIGISRAQWGLLAAALSLGGNVRVGLEDNFYLPDGDMARSNGDLVARAERWPRMRAAGGDGGRGARDARAVSFYEPLGDGRFRSTQRTRGPWDPRISTRGRRARCWGARWRGAARGDGAARLTFEILARSRSARDGRVSVERPGRSVELLAGELRAGGRTVMRRAAGACWARRVAPGWRCRRAARPRSPPPPALGEFGYARSVEWRWSAATGGRGGRPRCGRGC